jgi:hypothetical protein
MAGTLWLAIALKIRRPGNLVLRGRGVIKAENSFGNPVLGWLGA